MIVISCGEVQSSQSMVLAGVSMMEGQWVAMIREGLDTDMLLPLLLLSSPDRSLIAISTPSGARLRPSGGH